MPTSPPRGVRWSGLDPDAPVTLTAAQRAAQAARRADTLARWESAPQRAFLRSLSSLERLGWRDEAHRARACLSRGFAAPDGAPNTREVGAALKLLNRIGHSDARSAVDALADLLLG